MYYCINTIPRFGLMSSDFLVWGAAELCLRERLLSVVDVFNDEFPESSLTPSTAAPVGPTAASDRLRLDWRPGALVRPTVTSDRLRLDWSPGVRALDLWDRSSDLDRGRRKEPVT